MTLADRLLAGEHHGCATWTEVARKLGVDERHMRVVRKTLAAKGKQIALQPAEITGAQSHGTKPTVQVCAETKWPSVDAFDREQRMVIERRSTLYDGEGNIKLIWEKEKAENDERRDWLEAIRDMGGELPKVEAQAGPEHAAEDLAVVVPVGDPHVGLLSWREDAGENFDLEIAEQRYMRAFEHLISLAPPASECALVFIGDTAHADGQSNTTTRGTRVDVDGRIIKVARTILRICRHAVGLALAKFGKVTVIIERGNHDELVSAMIALALAQHYEYEPRVDVDQSPAMYHWWRFGRVLIGTHHGDKAKPMDLLGVMAVDQAAIWGECTHRRFYLGHYHHQIVKEVPGLVCEYLPTLATSDAWHHSMGYRSARAMYLDVYHREHGHINRHIVGMSQLRAA